jgi:tRNA A-37 threonylcarbamoyl transferase component Bud32
MLAPGVVAGSYRILAPLGEGGMAVVYLAEHMVLGSKAAVKVLHAQTAANQEIVQRFVNEARASARLKHRNIVQVHDCGRLPDGQWFIALEFLDGAPLSKFIASHGGPLALPTIVQILAQTANGLHVAHEHGIVHRDVKPDNLYLTCTQDNDHHVTILDFGIAKLGDDIARVRTRTNVAIGTPAYMAPEQLRDSKTVDRRSDVYALGAIAFEMATGRYLWGGESNPVTIYDWQRHTPRPDPRAVRADAHPAVAEVISRALAFEPDQRWQTAQEFALALAHAAPGTEWSESGMEILRRYATELAPVAVDADTVGRRVPGIVSHAGPATGPAVPVVPPYLAMPADGTLVAVGGRAAGIRTAPLGPAVATTGPSMPTTLGASVGQTSTEGGRPRRPWWVLGALALGIAVAAVGSRLTGADAVYQPRPSASPATEHVDSVGEASASVQPVPPDAASPANTEAQGATPRAAAAPATAAAVKADVGGRAPIHEAPITSATVTAHTVPTALTPGARGANDRADVAPSSRPVTRPIRRPGSGHSPGLAPSPAVGVNPDDVVGD